MQQNQSVEKSHEFLSPGVQDGRGEIEDRLIPCWQENSQHPPRPPVRSPATVSLFPWPYQVLIGKGLIQLWGAEEALRKPRPTGSAQHTHAQPHRGP